MTTQYESEVAQVKRTFKMAVLLVLGIIALFSTYSLFESVDANELMVVQSPASGQLTFHTTPGVKWQGFGKVTNYPKRSTYEFQTQVRFNDGGHATMRGSVQWEMPMDQQNLAILHTQFGSPESIQAQLVEKVVNKAVYMTGPLMSSKESYAEKRNYLINYVEDQIANGVFRTIQRDIKVTDPLTGQEKSAVVVEIVHNNGQPARQEQSALTHYNIKTSNFAIKEMPYDDQVEKQIQQQQQITMQVQTAIAESRQAEQRAITVEQQGRANAAQAKWEQEVVKAKQVTEAESRLAVQKLANDEAEQYRQATLKRAEADAGYRRQVMQADGALEQKLKAFIEVNGLYADAIKNYKGNWVPNVQTGGGTTNGNAATTLVELLTAKTAKDMGLELSK